MSFYLHIYVELAIFRTIFITYLLYHNIDLQHLRGLRHVRLLLAMGTLKASSFTEGVLLLLLAGMRIEGHQM